MARRINDATVAAVAAVAKRKDSRPLPYETQPEHGKALEKRTGGNSGGSGGKEQRLKSISERLNPYPGSVPLLHKGAKRILAQAPLQPATWRARR